MTILFTGSRLERARTRFVDRLARYSIVMNEASAKRVTDIVNAALDRPAVMFAASRISADLGENGLPSYKDRVLEAVACFHGHPNWDSLSAQLPQPKPRQLPAGLWAHNRFSAADRPFGLCDGQMHSILGEDRKLTHNSGWLNREGDRLGYGDLSEGDMVRIASGIEPGELFVVLPECKSDPDEWLRLGGTETRPQLKYLVEHVWFLVGPGAAHEIPRYSEPDAMRRKIIGGVVLDEIGREQAEAMLARNYGAPAWPPARSR